MPYKSEKIKIEGTANDRRVKLTDEQKSEIKKLHSEGSSIHGLSRQYKVDRRTIQFIVYPERLEENKKRRKERGGSKIYYVKEKHTKAIKKHRKHKQDLFLKGEINLNDKTKP